MDSSQAHSCSLDPRGPLEELALCASRYCLNLNGKVSKDDSDPLLRGGNATIYFGRYQRDVVGTSGDPGVGGFGTETLRVAIKTPRGGPPNFDSIKCVLKEVHVWSKLRHENVLSLLGITTQFDLTLSIVSPWMSKGNAHDYVQDRAVDPCPLIIGIAKGLHYLHSHKPSAIFHGDLKGVNVLISDTGNALLADFGFSHVVNSSFTTITDPNHHGLKGTINWLAPEMLDGAQVSAEADVWAFGMTTLELFTCKNPFHDIQSYGALITAIIRRPPTQPRDEDTHSRMTKMWWDMCYRCWNKAPSLRPTMAELVAEIAGSPHAAVSHSSPNGALQINGLLRQT